MPFINRICPWDEFFIPPGIPGLIASNQKNTDAASIEREQNSVRSALVLTSQFLHVWIFLAMHGVRVRSLEVRSAFLQ